jgi:hypothetical protein
MKFAFFTFENGLDLFSGGVGHPSLWHLCQRNFFARWEKAGSWHKMRSVASREKKYFRLFQYRDSEFPGESRIEAETAGIQLDENSSCFLGRFLCCWDGIISGPGNISVDETAILLENLLAAFPDMNGIVLSGGKVLLWFREKCPVFDWAYPQVLTGKNFRAFLPRRNSFQFCVNVIENSPGILGELMINRIRIDLNQNPANFLWFYGQGTDRVRPEPISNKIAGKAFFWPCDSSLSTFARYLGFEIKDRLSPELPANSFFWCYIDDYADTGSIGLSRRWERFDREVLAQFTGVQDLSFVVEFAPGRNNVNSKSMLFFYPAVNLVEQLSFVSGRNLAFGRRLVAGKGNERA